MLSEQELDTLYGEVNRPYSPKELTAHLADREVKSALEATHAHNLELIAQVQGWIDFFKGKGPRPENKLWRLLMPGTNEENPACLRFETITEHFAQYGHGDTPRMPIVVITSRSTVTLIELLDELNHTGHLDEALSHIKNFFALITYGGARKMSQTAFAKRIRGEMAQFIANCSANAKELGIALIERVRSGDDWPPKPASAADVKTAADSAAEKIAHAIETGSAKIAKTVRKKPGKKPRFSLEVQESAQSIWERDKKNPVIKGRKNHKVGHEDSFSHSKSDYLALGIHDVETLDRVLGAKSDRTGRSNKRRIGRL